MGVESPTTASPAPLDYARAPSSLRRNLRRAFLTIIIVAAATAGLKWGPVAWQQMQILYWQRQCMNYTAPPEMVVYDENADAVKNLPLLPGYSLRPGANPSGKMNPPQPAAIFHPAVLDHFLESIYGAPAQRGGVIFLGELKTPAGESRMVAIEYGDFAGMFYDLFWDGVNYQVLSFRSADLLHKPVMRDIASHTDIAMTRNFAFKRGWSVRIFAGQRDPADPSHFTFRYQMWGIEHVGDGRMDNQGDVKLNG